ncbi:MAG TPA: hypothetical protein VJN01_10945, partial [Xanthomonadales bacterium]|nr:hypothetical protein [Xanthomonadales bacterium]
MVIFLQLPATALASDSGRGYGELLDLFASWRSFETPPLRAGAPDYTAATFNDRYKEFKVLQQRLDS